MGESLTKVAGGRGDERVAIRQPLNEEARSAAFERSDRVERFDFEDETGQTERGGEGIAAELRRVAKDGVDGRLGVGDGVEGEEAHLNDGNIFR